MEYKFIDCYCSFFETLRPMESVSYKKEDIRKKLEAVNVKKAFCFNNKGDNNLLLSDDFFLPSFTLDPNCDTEDFEKYFTIKNAKMVNISPLISKGLFENDTYKKYFSIMDKYGAVITINIQMATKETLKKILCHYTNIKIIVVSISFDDAFHITELMKKYNNLYVDTGFTSILALENIIKDVGSQKIVYSSYMPETDPSGGIGRIILMNLSDNEKENIAYKNISSITGVEI